ncbi:hypothetical protein PR002_g27147 [Phytophthora rubi]|uniref:Uncharacterized protein n=2 Tax=Phytophthora rubi TaxID=129364 RepID=A0A6A3HJF1_9STRA|nr:hypothetical protein PR002_g27147 [Phytophthora rubi]
MSPATSARRSSPRRVSLDANTPNQDRAAQGPDRRSSPYQRRSPRLELLREVVSSHDPLIKLSVDVRLKNTVNQRLSSSGRIGTHRVQCDTWDEVKTKLWDIIRSQLKPLAVLTGTPPVWAVDEHDPAIEMFEKYTSMRMNTKMLDPWTSAKDRRYLSRNQHESVLLSVYKYGNEISTIGQLADFEDQCIGPAATDRGGAATEELHQLMISLLKEKWGATLTAQDMSWRLWASLVLKKPRPQHEREIAKGPPSSLITQFKSASNASDQHLQRVQRSVKMAKKVVQGMQAKVKHFEQTVQVLQTAIVSMNQMLENHLDVIEAMGEDVVIQPDSTEVMSALADIPNQEDVDHA